MTVEIYNNKRPHYSLKLNTPNFVYLNRNVDYHSYKRNKEILQLLTIYLKKMNRKWSTYISISRRELDKEPKLKNA